MMITEDDVKNLVYKDGLLQWTDRPNPEWVNIEAEAYTLDKVLSLIPLEKVLPVLTRFFPHSNREMKFVYPDRTVTSSYCIQFSLLSTAGGGVAQKGYLHLGCGSPDDFKRFRQTMGRDGPYDAMTTFGVYLHIHTVDADVIGKRYEVNQEY